MTEPLFNVILDVVARHYSMPVATILADTRMKSVIVARHTAMYVARIAGNFSYTEIGDVFHRDHTSVMNAVSKITRRTVAVETFKTSIDQLVKEVLSYGSAGGPVRIRAELLTRLQNKVDQGIYGASIEDLVDRILCEHFQRETAK